MSREKIHFVTGRLAAPALREIVSELASQVGFDYSIQVLPITVAALLTPKWIADRIEVPEGTTKVLLPGYADGDLAELRTQSKVTVEVGPKDLRQLPAYFGQATQKPPLEQFDIRIIAEINHAPRMTVQQVVDEALSLVANGADIVDIGCEPQGGWDRVGEYVKAVVEQGIAVSIDSLNIKEIEAATTAGAELVLSVNHTNRHAAADWGVEVVVVPDEIASIESMEQTLEWLEKHSVPNRIDPILEPIGFGFAASLQRYMTARARWPDAEMMMGVGNLTELTDVDSAGVNLLLLAICQELGIRSVLTTQVINWARSSVSEIEIARRLVHHSVNNRVPPKRISDQLVCLRDASVMEFGSETLQKLAASIKDSNYRIFSESDALHLLGNELHFSAEDPFEIFDELAATEPKNLDPSHAFYLGYELCKANIARQLGKQYTQDEALTWGHLTVSEQDRHRLKKKRNR